MTHTCRATRRFDGAIYCHPCRLLWDADDEPPPCPAAAPPEPKPPLVKSPPLAPAAKPVREPFVSGCYRRDG